MNPLAKGDKEFVQQTGNPLAIASLQGVTTLELTARQQLAVLLDSLFTIGYNDHMAGHITLRLDDETLLCSPWGPQWDEVTATDIIRIDLQGNRLEGHWPVPPGIPLHLALHNQREHVRLAVHNHTRHSGLWAAAHKIPPVIDQTSGLTDATVVLVDEFDGAVEEYDIAAEAIQKMKGADIALLANHGVFVLGDSIAEAYFRCYVFEWRCQRAIEVSAIGEGVALRPSVHSALAKTVVSRGFPGFWDAAVKRSVLRRPAVLF
jgi:ribulose-5-phosphate 4-epimerase/fuculose-1-phosphate aldolase